MLELADKIIRRLVRAPLKRILKTPKKKVTVKRAMPGSWCATRLPSLDRQTVSTFNEIEAIATATQSLGERPLWEGFSQIKNYPTNTATGRTSNQVRTSSDVGRIYTWAAIDKKPNLIVEFGTAFGVSGMYWLAGIEANGRGHLLTFEPNQAWADIAKSNLSRISDKFTLTIGTFEDNLAVVDQFPAKIDMAFIDAIHTSEFVFEQLDLVERRCAPGALIILDDITFSDDMCACWRAVSKRPRYAAVAEIGGRSGLVELAR
ncbi:MULTISPECIES: class I SAM-dependent methyltransferase [unclassified Mesorhizobium]|uniref:O-methyltransferase n=1 Tax=unclassified Mesorhizobium TaxID=325217 RepID=UPI00333729FF